MVTRRTQGRNGVGRSLVMLGLGLLCLGLAGWSGVAPVRAQTSATLLTGYVFDYKGAFVGGATITLYSLPQHQQIAATTTTDANGQFQIDTGLGNFAIRASAPGYDYSEQTIFASSYKLGVTFILRPLGQQGGEPLVAHITGHVTDLDNVPLGGMNIVATNAQDTGVREIPPPPALNVAVTNADGAYSIEVPAGTIWLTLKTASAWGYQLVPMNITAGQMVTGADFRAAVRVLPRSDFPSPTAVPTAVPPPTPTATPIANVGGNIGMPSTGGSAGSSPWTVLAALGLLALASGSLLTRISRVRR